MKVDPQLALFKHHLQYRHSQYTKLKSAIEKVEGSLPAFAQVLLLSHFSDCTSVTCCMEYVQCSLAYAFEPPHAFPAKGMHTVCWCVPLGLHALLAELNALLAKVCVCMHL